MSAVAVAVMGGTALMGYEQQQHQNKIADSQRMRRSAEQQYSPWTGIKDFTQVQDPSSSALGAGLGGALSGAAFAQKLNKGFGSDKPTTTGGAEPTGGVADSGQIVETPPVEASNAPASPDASSSLGANNNYNPWGDMGGKFRQKPTATFFVP